MTDTVAHPAVHWDNPWKNAVPVPLEELAGCVAGGTIRTPEGVKDYTVGYVIEAWRKFGDRLDGYILIGGETGAISVGVRYGDAGHQYLSPYCQNDAMARDLVRKYEPAPEQVAPSSP
jgi:hypothetical protein